MNREEFILALRKELSKLPPEEVVEATQYFEECFEEATEGLEENEKLAEEQRLIEEFGSPKRIATQVKADYAARLLDGDETVIDKKPTATKKLSAVWWVIIGVCTAPVSIPIAIGIVCVIIALICVAIQIYAAIIGGGIGTIGAIVMGGAFLSSSVPSGVMTMGIGLAGLAVSAAAAVGAFIGTKELIKAIARKAKEQNEKRKNKKYSNMAEGAEDAGVWVRTDEEWYDLERGEE